MPVLEMISISEIKSYRRNVRKHSKKQIRKLATAIETFGFIAPIVTDGRKQVVAGEARLQAAKQLGLKVVPCIQVAHLSPSQISAYRLADNRIAEDAQWNETVLKIELQELYELNIDLELTGFEGAEIDGWMQLEMDEDELNEAPNIPAPPSSPASRIGDLFTLGDHRLVCGDACDSSVLSLLMGGNRCGIVIIDPPYNLKTQDIRGHSEHDFEDFPMAAGEMSSIEFIDFLTCLMENFASVSQDGALHYYFMDWRHLHDLLTAAQPLFNQFINLCVWCKNNGGMGSFYRSRHELITVFKHGSAPHINNIELGVHGRYRTNVWNYAGLSAFGEHRDTELAMHPTVKPVPLLKDILLDASRINDIVLDGCLGSGSTLIAAQRTRRRCYGIELDPHYVDVTIQRWQQETGEQAIHEESGLTFDALSEQRANHQEGNHA